MEAAGVGPAWQALARAACSQGAQRHLLPRSARMHSSTSLTRAPAQRAYPHTKPQPGAHPKAHVASTSGCPGRPSPPNWASRRSREARGAAQGGQPAFSTGERGGVERSPQASRATSLGSVGQLSQADGTCPEGAWTAREDEDEAHEAPVGMPFGGQTQGPGGRRGQGQGTRGVSSRHAGGEPVVYHFAFGSNLSSQKLLNRVPGGLRPLHWEPAVVYGHRLAFNLRGINVVEPSWASIEPVEQGAAGSGGALPLGPATGPGNSLANEWAPQVHGILLTLEPKDYEALYMSEGGAAGPFSAYVEHRVQAVTYSGETYEAVAFRTNPSSPVRLPRSQEQLPSRRYLGLIVEGAKERGLHRLYIARLEKQLARIRDPWALLL